MLRVDVETMPIVRRIFRMVVWRVTPSVKSSGRRCRGTPTQPQEVLSETFIREVIKMTFIERTLRRDQRISDAGSSGRLDPYKRYGIWWFNRQRHTFKQVVENTPEGKVYRRRKKVVDKPRMNGSPCRCGRWHTVSWSIRPGSYQE
jgi:hypothetical protein